jgi:hypothetical protein
LEGQSSPYFSKHLRSLLESCWHADSPQRPECSDIGNNFSSSGFIVLNF